MIKGNSNKSSLLKSIKWPFMRIEYTIIRYKPERYHKPEIHENVEPNPMPQPLKPFNKKYYYQEYTTTYIPTVPYVPPTFPPVPDVQPLPK